MLHLESIENQIINNNYMFPSVLPVASFGLCLYTSANKPEEQSLCSSRIENKYILFYPLNISLNWPRKFVKKQAEDGGCGGSEHNFSDMQCKQCRWRLRFISSTGPLTGLSAVIGVAE